MKKFFVITILLLLVGGSGGGYYWKTRSNAKKDIAATATAKVERTDLRMSVTSTGKVVANLDVDIKSKASGEIVELPFDVSDLVHKDQLLVKLDPIDMQRMVQQSQAALGSSQARLATAQANLAIAGRTLSTDREKAATALKSAQAHATDARAKADRMKQLLEKKLASQEDCDTAETAAVQSATDLDNARIKLEELTTQEQALELRRQDVKLAEAQVESDKISLSISKDRLDDTEVKAPMDGVVAARPVQIGQIIASGVSNVGGGTTIMTLSDLSHIYVLASVDESDIGKVKVGQPAVITADAFAGKKFQGQVVRIATRGVNVSNVVTFEVKIEVLGEKPSRSAAASSGQPRSFSRDPKGSVSSASAATQPEAAQRKFLLRPEMTANIEIIAEERTNVLAVPNEAAVRKGSRQFVTVLTPDGAQEEREIKLGISSTTQAEVVSGLDEGDQVVIRGSGSKWTAGQQGGPRGPMMFPGGGRR